MINPIRFLKRLFHRPTTLNQLDANSLSTLLAHTPRSQRIQKICGKLPSPELQARFTGLSARQTFLQAITYLEACRTVAVQRCRCWSGVDTRVLDFGCGWGRITQLLSIHFNPENIIAGDVQNDALKLCQDNGVRAAYELLSPWPPSLIADASLDFVFAYSVFSHLSEKNADAWVREFHRILKPGGIAFLTTRHRTFFDYLESLHQREKGSTADFARGAAGAFRDTTAARANFDAGEFCFDPMGGGGPGLTPVYGEAFIPQAWAHKNWGGLYTSVEYIDPIHDGLLDQATLVLIK